MEMKKATVHATDFFTVAFKPFTSLNGFLRWYTSATYAGAFINPAIINAVIPVFNRKNDILPRAVLRQAQSDLIDLGILTPDSTLGI
jgi:hypothetical protein